MSGCPRVLVVGAGAAGTLTALHLLRVAASGGTRLDVVLLDPAVRWARGAAFGTTDPRHLLNVPARGMSALPEQPDDFVVWRQRMGLGGDGDTFAPRMEWSRYLADLVYEARRQATGTAMMTHRRVQVVGLRRDSEGLVVSREDGEDLPAEAVVVATGLPSPGDHWAPAELRASPRFVADPLDPRALAEVRRSGGDVLLVGTGLTMVDVALTLGASGERSGRLLAISRSGRLPARHLARRLPPVLPDVSDWGSSLADIRECATRHVAEVLRYSGDWRPGVDGVRHRVAELWQRLDDADRAAFVARDAGPWNLLRHRMPPTSAATVGALRSEGRLEVQAAEVVGATPLPHGLRIDLSDGSTREVAWVVNCTGPRSDVRTLGNPLLDDLLRPRPDGALATVAHAGMGLRTAGGRLVDGRGSATTPLWTLGALRRGELWESTAVPEIREQAAAVASQVVEHTAGVGRTSSERTPLLPAS